MQLSQLQFNEIERIAYITGHRLTAMCAGEAAATEALLEYASDASTYIDEAKGSMPGEDCLQEFIDELNAMAMWRVTKAEVKALAERLEELQTQLAQSSEYGLEQLAKAQQKLN